MHFLPLLPSPAAASAASSALAALLAALPPAAAQQCGTGFVGGDLAGASEVGGLEPSLSADGRRIVDLQYTFLYHAYLHDRRTGVKVLVDALSDGTRMDGACSGLALSADGLHAAYLSSAQNAGAIGLQVYVRDLSSGALQIASVAPDATPMTPTGTVPGMGTASISAHGGKVAFTSDSKELVPGKTTSWRDVFVRDLVAGTTTRVLGQNGVEPDLPALFEPALSSDGRFVAFASRARNLVPGDTNQHDDVFVHDLASGSTERLSVGWTGTQADHDSQDPVISADGRYVAFVSRASNLAPGDTNGVNDVFVHDRATGLTQRANLGPAGAQANAGSVGPPRISAGGQHVLFHSTATNLLSTPVSGARLYLRDLEGQTTSLVVDSGASPGEYNVCGLSADGQTVAFASQMPFGPSDTNGFFDVFLRACVPGAPVSYCPVTASSSGCAASIDWTGVPSVSAGTGFVLRTHDSTSHQLGLLIYGVSGGYLSLISTSFLCVFPPLGRSGGLDSGGNPPPQDCSGSFSLDFNAWIARGADPTLIEGTLVWAQFWCRDGGAVGGGHLSNAVTFAIGP